MVGLHDLITQNMKCFLYFETSDNIKQIIPFVLNPWPPCQKTRALGLQIWKYFQGCQIFNMAHKCNDFALYLGRFGPSSIPLQETWEYPQVLLVESRVCGVDDIRERSLKIFFYVKKMVTFDMEWNFEHTIIDHAHNTKMKVLDNKHYIDHK